MTASEEDQQRPLLKRRSVLILLLALVLAGAIAATLILSSGTPQPSAARTPSAVPSTPSATDVPAPTADPSAPPATPDPDDEPGEAIETPIDEPATTGGLEIEVVSVDAIEGTADEPGEIAGPAIRVSVRFENHSDKAISMRNTVVTVDAGPDRIPAPELNEADGPRLTGELDAGDSAQGVYVFTLPESSRNDVRITVHTSVSAPTVVFSGAVPA